MQANLKTIYKFMKFKSIIISTLFIVFVTFNLSAQWLGQVTYTGNDIQKTFDLQKTLDEEYVLLFNIPTFSNGGWSARPGLMKIDKMGNLIFPNSTIVKNQKYLKT